MKKVFRISYYDEIEAENEQEACRVLLQHLEKDVKWKDLTAWKVEKTIDMNVPVEITCKTHGGFMMTPNDHRGHNPEKVAYGCPKCGDEKRREE